MPVKSIELELPDDLYMKIGAVASEHFETENGYLQNVISDAIREELELNCLKRDIVSRYAIGEIGYESLKTLLGFKEAERIRTHKETILESLLEADEVAGGAFRSWSRISGFMIPITEIIGIKGKWRNII